MPEHHKMFSLFEFCTKKAKGLLSETEPEPHNLSFKEPETHQHDAALTTD
jgi:hypothetical protein